MQKVKKRPLARAITRFTVGQEYHRGKKAGKRLFPETGAGPGGKIPVSLLVNTFAGQENGVKVSKSDDSGDPELSSRR